MNRRRTPARTAAALAVVLTVALAACGEDTTNDATNDEGSSESLPTVPAPTESPGSTDAPASDTPSSDIMYEHPTGADDVVVSYAELGGFVPVEVAFQQTPQILVSGDGHVFTPGAQIAIYPGPLLPAIQIQTITEAGMQSLLAAADEAGLLAEVDYTDESTDIVADASTATVTISADGDTWVHEAYALGALGLPGEEEETTAEREALGAFIEELRDLPALVGADNLGEPELYDAEAFLIEARPIDDLSAFAGDDIEPTVVDWPADVSVTLADASSCTEVPAAEVGALFADADQLTFFSDDDTVYQVLVRPKLPGDSCA